MLPDSVDLDRDSERLIDACFDSLRFSPALLCPGDGA
jgi:TetR/AcrR family acrAB operon transcriptional repressor